MARNKKSFVVYCDLIHTVEKLSDKDAGELFKHLLRYVNDQNPETENALVDLAFEPIKQQLKRDLKHWESIREKRSEAGRKGGKQKQANASKSKQNVANLAVNVNDTVNVTVNDNVNAIEKRKAEFKNSLLSEFINQYDEKMLLDFFEYWTEHSPKARKMRYEKEKAFDVTRRLKTWARNQKKFGGVNNGFGEIADY